MAHLRKWRAVTATAATAAIAGAAVGMGATMGTSSVTTAPIELTTNFADADELPSEPSTPPITTDTADDTEANGVGADGPATSSQPPPPRPVIAPTVSIVSPDAPVTVGPPDHANSSTRAAGTSRLAQDLDSSGLSQDASIDSVDSADSSDSVASASSIDS